MDQDPDTSKNQVLGYQLHVTNIKLLGDFLKGAEVHFQYLQEILAEAKEHFVRRESVELLPKTPCMKRKRKRVPRSPQCSPILASSPLQSLPSADVQCKTPVSKKPATCKETKSKVSDLEACSTTSNEYPTRPGKTKTSRAKKPPKTAQRKQPRQNAKKASALDEASVIKTEDTHNKEMATPKRMTRNKRKVAEKETGIAVGNGNAKKKNKIQEETSFVEENLDNDREATPKRVTRNNIKHNNKEMVVLDSREKLKVKEVCTPSPQVNKAKCDQACIETTPQNVKVFISETPQTEQKLNEATPTKTTDVKAVRTSIQFVPTPKLEKENNENEVNVYVKEQEVCTSNVVVVEARVYETENHGVTTSTPEKEPISEPTVTSTKTLKRETRSSGRGTKRKLKNDRAQDKKSKMSSPILPECPAQAEISSQQKSTPDQEPANCDPKEAVVTSTVNSPPKPQHRSFRPSRGTRRSSRLSVQANKNRQTSKTRKSKCLVKSSVTFKLYAKKLKPVQDKSSEGDENLESSSEFAKENVTKQLLFEESNVNEKDTHSDPEGIKEDPLRNVEKDSKIKTDDTASTCNHDNISKQPVCVTSDNNKDDGEDRIADNGNDNNTDVDDYNDGDDHKLAVVDHNDDNEVFHDASESSEEEFHDASEKLNNTGNAHGSGPVTRSSSGNQSRESTKSSGQDSNGSIEKESSPCKETSDECDHTQSSPEPSQEHCILVDDGSSGSMVDEQDQNLFGFQNKVLKNHAGVVDSFIKRNTPKIADRQEKSRIMKIAIQEKEEKEKERLERLAMGKQKRIEDQKRRRKEKELKVAGIRAVKIREQKEKKQQLEKKQELRRALEEKAKKLREKEEEAKRKARQEKAAEIEARRKQEEEQRKRKIIEKEEEARQHQEMMQRKAEFEEQQRHKKILEAKRHLEQRELELQREKQRMKKEMEEKERKAKEERENQEKKLIEEKEKLEKKLREDKQREEKERKRIAALLKEKEETERKELKAREEKLRKEREIKYRLQEEAEKERRRLRQLQEEREKEEARLRALRAVDSYDMTPPPPPKVRSEATNENYNIDDICSDDSTDDEDAPKKKIPQWAQGAKLKALLINQSAMSLGEVEAIFGGISMPNIDEIFTQKKRKRFYQRTSSANWNTPPLKTLNKGTLI